MYAFVISQYLTSMLQAESYFGLTLPVEGVPRLVSIISTEGDSPQYRLRFSDDTESEPLLFEQLNGLARLLLAQTRSKHKTTAKPKRKAKKQFGRDDRSRSKNRSQASKSRQKKQRSGVPAIDSVHVGSESAQKKAKKASERPLRPFSTAKEAELLQNTIEADWERELDTNKEEIAAFPRVPNDARLRFSLQKWRQLVSSPNVDQGVCAVCAQQFNAKHTTTFALNGHSEGDYDLIHPAILKAIKQQLQHDEARPSHLTELPECKQAMIAR